MKIFHCLLLFLFINNHLDCRISILTKPIDAHGDFWHHHGVTRSLIDGFNALGVDFNYNPSYSTIGDTVIILSNIQAIYQCIELKQKGKIKKILAGPNLVILPFDHNRILTHPAIDRCIVPSDWVKIAYEACEPLLKGRIGVWFAGVDVNYWNPISPKVENSNVLVYWKTEPESFCNQVELLLRSYGWNPIRVRYGNYNSLHFKNLLEQSRFAVFISITESQGLALAEAWSMNVPTLVWNNGNLAYQGFIFSVVSACPYLTKSTGKEWKTLNELEEILKNYLLHEKSFNTRDWTLNYMSDRVSAQCILKIIDSI